MLTILENVYVQSSSGILGAPLLYGIKTLMKFVTFTEKKDKSHIQYLDKILDLYDADIHQCRKYPSRERFLQDILSTKIPSLTIGAYDLSLLADQAQYDKKAKQLIIAYLVILNINNSRLQKHLEDSKATGSNGYPQNNHKNSGYVVYFKSRHNQ